MGKTQTFQEFLTTQSVHIPILGFMVNLLLAAFLAYVLSLVYVRFGHALSNRRLFARNFVLITMTTMLIISIVKSSLALSLGLVGALSIVRFRAAIKEPEELAYLFLAIGLGLGFGADQTMITLLAFALIIGVIWLRNYSLKQEQGQNLHLTVSSHNPHKIELQQIVDTLNTHCRSVNLKRFDETKEALEASFQVEFENFDALEKSKAGLQNLSESVKITFLDTNGLYV